MNPNDNTDYNPAEDENQGVITKLVQGEDANNGVSQLDYMNPVTNQGPEPVKEEVNDPSNKPVDSGLPLADSNGINDDLLAEEDVADRNITETEGDQ
ncbi:MAG TPA: hypothetical protein VK404_00450 [Spirosoma sp.]|nr:hypothetical protein [Spirosoma sp.]